MVVALAKGSVAYRSTTHWRELRKRVINRDGWKCTQCGNGCYGKKRKSSTPHVDHIDPRPVTASIATASDVMKNLQLLCHTCHNRKTRSEDINDKHPTGADGFPVGSAWGDAGPGGQS